MFHLRNLVIESAAANRWHGSESFVHIIVSFGQKKTIVSKQLDLAPGQSHSELYRAIVNSADAHPVRTVSNAMAKYIHDQNSVWSQALGVHPTHVSVGAGTTFIGGSASANQAFQARLRPNVIVARPGGAIKFAGTTAVPVGHSADSMAALRDSPTCVTVNLPAFTTLPPKDPFNTSCINAQVYRV